MAIRKRKDEAWVQYMARLFDHHGIPSEEQPPHMEDAFFNVKYFPSSYIHGGRGASGHTEVWLDARPIYDGDRVIGPGFDENFVLSGLNTDTLIGLEIIGDLSNFYDMHPLEHALMSDVRLGQKRPARENVARMSKLVLKIWKEHNRRLK